MNFHIKIVSEKSKKQNCFPVKKGISYIQRYMNTAVREFYRAGRGKASAAGKGIGPDGVKAAGKSSRSCLAEFSDLSGTCRVRKLNFVHQILL
jgi:hypothetical protein